MEKWGTCKKGRKTKQATSPPASKPPDTLGIYKAGQFYLSSNNQAVLTSFTYGPTSSWTAAAGDWDGNGKDTVGVVNNNEVTLTDNNSTTSQHFWFGTGSPWKMIWGDWDGNGTTTVGIYSNNEFYLS